jgi:hypothetical protein
MEKVSMRRDASGDQSHSAATVSQRVHYAPGGGGGGFGGLGGGGFGGLGCSMGDSIPECGRSATATAGWM